jgi:hypothetical protein
MFLLVMGSSILWRLTREEQHGLVFSPDAAKAAEATLRLSPALEGRSQAQLSTLGSFAGKWCGFRADYLAEKGTVDFGPAFQDHDQKWMCASRGSHDFGAWGYFVRLQCRSFF